MIEVILRLLNCAGYVCAWPIEFTEVNDCISILNTVKLKLLACISLGAVWVIKQCLKSHIIMGRPPHFVWGFARYEVVRQRDVWFSPKHSLIWLPRFYVHSSMKTLWKHSTEGCLKETIHFYLNNSRWTVEYKSN